jgi:hypothetical protein
MFAKALLSAGIVFAHNALAQFPPIPKGVTEVKSKFHKGITISYKEVMTLR